MSTTEHLRLRRRGYALEIITLGWNVIGVIVLAVLALAASSVALAGFGLDSLIEIGASTVVLWELIPPRNGHSTCSADCLQYWPVVPATAGSVMSPVQGVSAALATTKATSAGDAHRGRLAPLHVRQGHCSWSGRRRRCHDLRRDLVCRITIRRACHGSSRVCSGNHQQQQRRIRPHRLLTAEPRRRPACDQAAPPRRALATP